MCFKCLILFAADIIRSIDPQFNNVQERLKTLSSFLASMVTLVPSMEHISLSPAKNMINHFGRHGYSSQNVMVVCDFDMRYISVVAGWPGSAHDTRIFKDTFDNHKERSPHLPAGISFKQSYKST